MLRSKLGHLYAMACVSSALLGITTPALSAPALTVEQIVEKNIAARGGLKSWRDVQAIKMTGKIDAGSQKNVQLPIVMTLKRPRMSRVEIEFAGKTALQVYDGTNGWKVRPFLNRLEVEPFTEAEKQAASDPQGLDGPLIDLQAKGTKAELEGTEEVEGHDAYRLRLTLNNNNVRHLWVDAQSFLEVKMEGTPRVLDGKPHKVEVYFRNYGSISGLMIPFVLETVVENVTPSRKINIEKVVLNPNLEANAFERPEIPGASLKILPQRGAVQSGSTDMAGVANEKSR